MAREPKVNVAEYVTGLLEGNIPFHNAQWNAFGIPEAFNKGSLQVPVMDAPTLADPVDGTMVTNGANERFVSLVYDSKLASISVEPEEDGSIDADEVRAFGISAAQEFSNNLNSVVIADLISETLTATANLANDNFSDPTATADLAAMNTAIFDIAGKSGSTLNDMWIALPTTGFGNFNMLRATQIGQSIQHRADGILTFNEVPMFQIPVTSVTAWGGTSTGDSAAFIGAKRGYAVAFQKQMVKVHSNTSNGLFEASDGFTKLILKNRYATGLLTNTLIYELKNP